MCIYIYIYICVCIYIYIYIYIYAYHTIIMIIISIHSGFKGVRHLAGERPWLPAGQNDHPIWCPNP